MAYRRQKVNSEEVSECGRGFRLAIIENEEVKAVRQGGRLVEFTGPREAILTISDPDYYADAAIVGLAVRSAMAVRDGALSIAFTDGSEMGVPWSVYEAWELRSNGTLHLVSVAGGGVALWT